MTPSLLSAPPLPGRGADPQRRVRILFMAEAVTLAHLARPLTLASALAPQGFDICLACDPRCGRWLRNVPFRVRPLHTIPQTQFQAALDRGAPVYDLPTLHAYVREDRDVIREFVPDVVVGDFRLSLAVSARLAGVPYLALCNAYWSPYARQRFPAPDLPWLNLLPPALADGLFRLARPLAFAVHAVPLNRLRRDYGLPALGYDLRRVYTEADHTLYADLPGLVPMADLPPHHQFVGPLLWSPSVPLPDWWDQVPHDRPLVYVSMGSSGHSSLLGRVLAALADLPVTVLAATAGHALAGPVPRNAFVTDYLPGDAAVRRASVVVCNGGSLGTQQALAAGVPVLGLPGNLDQQLNMAALSRTGAASSLRARRASVPAIRQEVTRLLADPSYRESAARLARVMEQCTPVQTFCDVVARVMRGQRDLVPRLTADCS